MVDEVRRVIVGLTAATEGVIKKLTLDIQSNLKEQPPLGTPVDLGWARANWVPKIGSPFQGDATDDPSTADVSAARARQSAGEAEILSYRLGQGAVFVSNNVPYIQRLNNGHSKQSPAGFVEAAIDKAVKDNQRLLL